ncbi:hypothetical protein ZWY2020_055268 [Hordeum vulgare]|nr:hypothetical protein ZWY2020_055268 [Hordeum vulgare]
MCGPAHEEVCVGADYEVPPAKNGPFGQLMTNQALRRQRWAGGATRQPLAPKLKKKTCASLARPTPPSPSSSKLGFPLLTPGRASGRYLHLSALHSFHSSSLCDMASTTCFVIVSKNDIPIYDAEVGSAPKKEDQAYQHQFILHAALDVVQDLAWATSAMFLKSVDRFNDLVVSVYVTAARSSHTRFMLLHDSRSEDGIKSFFQEVHELYIKIFLNPLYLPGSRITSSHFNTKVRALARKYL